MRAFDLIALLDKSVVPEKCKIHLATWTDRDEPLALFRAGMFEEWQRWQTKPNFGRPLVVALIEDRTAHRWLFGGVYRIAGHARGREKANGRDMIRYDLNEVPTCTEMKGRLLVSFQRPGRQSYLNAERWTEQIVVSEILAEPLSVQAFPGFKLIDISKMELDAVIGREVESWRSALSSVGGVYLISDGVSGQLYVGSASGEGGFWNRWKAYSKTGHGDNKELKELLRGTRPERAARFRFSILEIADLATKPEEVFARESHWKQVLMSRDHGLNRN
jgi:hypothetical protein